MNLADNKNLDTLNGGFTVFGNVLGQGMVIVDAIDNQPTLDLGFKASEAPYVTAAYSTPLDFLYMNIEIVERLSAAPHVFEATSGLLITSVDIDNGLELLSMNFNTVPAAGEVIIQANLESVIPRRGPVDGIATFSTSDNRLRIPSLEISSHGQAFLVSNVVFVLSNTSPVQFTLESYQQ